MSYFSTSLKVRICVVTPDLLGPVRNGGIGTACTFLAHALSEAGYQVSVLFSQCATSAKSTDSWVKSYRSRSISINIAEEWLKNKRRRKKYFPDHPVLGMAHTVHDWLTEHIFDVVIIMEWQGHGFYALQAKRAGLRFQNTIFITQTHSPSLWHALNNADLASDPMQSITYFMERKSVELADVVISPSAYMLNWLRQHGFNPPERSFVLPNLIEVKKLRKSTRCVRTHVNELVFFGRLEYRKGLEQFCDALDRLAKTKIAPQKVTFLGKFSRMGREHSGLYIARRAKKWKFPIEIQARLGQSEALAYLAEPGRLAVMPSVADNSPYTVYECLVAAIPFLARDVGGIAELIHPQDQVACLFSDNPGTLAQMFTKILCDGALVPRLGFDLEENRRTWCETLLAQIREIRASSPINQIKHNREYAKPPLVSVCLVHYNRPQLLKQAVASLMAQEYTNFEVILADDGSSSKAARKLLLNLEPEFIKRNWKILHLENGYLGKARNTAAKQAQGEYLLFMDDDNVAKPNMISRFVQAAVTSGADLVTAMFDVFSGNRTPTLRTSIVERFLPLGDIVSFSAISNCIGDANSLMRQSLFKKLGGFSEEYGLGHEDFELYLRAVLTGSVVSVVPESLFWYRRNGLSMLSTTHTTANRMRSFRPFMEFLPAPLAELAVLTHGLAYRQIVAAKTEIDAYDELPEIDRQRIKTGDPDAPETLAALIKLLILENQAELANQLLRQLNIDEQSVSSNSGISTMQYLLHALNVIRRGDFAEVKRIVSEFENVRHNNSDKEWFFLLLLAVLEKQDNASSLLHKYAFKLYHVPDKNTKSIYKTVHYLLLTGQIGAALQSFDALLLCLDAEYLQQRSDIAEAVRTGDFPWGMEHYFRHGKAEGIAWPGTEILQELISKIIPAIEQSKQKVNIRSDARIRLNLAIKLFADLKSSEQTKQH